MVDEDFRFLSAFQELVLNLSGRFVNLDRGCLDREIDRALQEIGLFAQVDRSYVFEFSSRGTRVSNTHEWCADGITTTMHRLQNAPVDRFAWALDRVLAGEVLYVERVADLPPDAAGFKNELEIQGIQSLLNVPLVCAGTVLGFVGFDSVRTAKAWREDHIRLLKVVGEIIAGAMERERATADLTRQVQMEKLLGHISTRFINVPTAELDAEIGQAIGRIGEFTGVDRSYVFGLAPGGETMDNTHEWCARGIEPQMHRLKSLPVDEFGYSMRRMRRGDVFHVPDVAALPSDAAREQEEFEREGIRTLINVPIMARGCMIGFLGFDAVRSPKAWNDNDIRLLRLVGEIIANALDRKATEERLEASVGEKELLLREIHHRVKNNMQIVNSLLYLQANAVRDHMDPVAAEAFRQSQNRIKTMATIHDRLYSSGDLGGVDFEDYLRTLIPELLATYAAGDNLRLSIEAENARLGIDIAMPCGLIVNELVTNSLKHAFSGDRSGAIEVGLRRLEGERMELVVGDDGVGLPAAVDWRRSKSLGLQLVRDLVRQMRGVIDLEEGPGTRFRILLDPG